ncbi:MAG: flagellar biosynthesis protein FlhF [Defluviitaleaceae bacterium]|nr:flagellar biosynthesis protein FlhF [Defluviitaleaceae bacterium]
MEAQKFVGNTEEEAIAHAKKALGENVLILNVEKIKIKSLFGISKKVEFEVSAMPGEKKEETISKIGEDFMKQMISLTKPNRPPENTSKQIGNTNLYSQSLKAEPNPKQTYAKEIYSKEEKAPNLKIANSARDNFENKEFKIENFEKTFNLLVQEDLSKELLKEQELLEKEKRIKELEEKLKALEAETAKKIETPIKEESKHQSDFINPVIQTFYEELIFNGVLPEIAKMLLSDLEEETEISKIGAFVYNKIIDILKMPTPIKNSSYDTKFIFFFGPTGVGKTTTIAKIASKLVLEENENVAMIAADTYRIGATEQLKIYANILSTSIDIIYEPKEFSASAIKFQNEGKSIVLVDTAGRSHKKSENLTELVELLDTPFINEKFLVLSSATKYEDLEDIILQFSKLGRFRIILTKFDETLSYGNVLNLCVKFGIEIVYITTGQNVPYDIEILSPQKIAKALLGIEVYQ